MASTISSPHNISKSRTGQKADMKTWMCTHEIALAGTPTVQVLDYWIATTTGDNPYNLLVAVIHFLVFGKGGNESEITRAKFHALLATFRNDSTVAAGSIYDGILLAMVVDGGAGMRFCQHYYAMLTELVL